MTLSGFFRVLLVFGLLFLVDWYAFTAIRTMVPVGRTRTIISWIYWSLSAAFMLFSLYVAFTVTRATGPTDPRVKILMGSFVLLYVPKLVVVLFLGLEDIYRLLRAGAVGIWKVTGSDGAQGMAFFESRRRFISQVAALAASIPALGILYGITKGKYNFKVHKVDLAFKDLPEAFHGLTITQISDLHIGSWEDAEEVKHAVNLINEQRSDLIFFTGDMVNNRADEMEPWADVFGELNAPMGKYSILGNHDYGDYSTWDSAAAKEANMEQLYGLHNRLGFRLLRNEHTRIEKDGSHLELLGMENWGKGFQQYGNLEKTMHGTRDGAFKILMSHDPSHWEEQVMNHTTDIHLTLAGHTHGMQFGVEIPGFRFSPVQLKYPRWAGLYTENNRNLYVNRGLGFIGFPGRVGIWPEITVITLQKA